MKNISYVAGSSNPQQTLDLYLPKEKKAGPLLVYAHGGAWITGDKSDYVALGERFTKQGIAVAVVNYRLSLTSDLRHPMAPKDLAASLNWLSTHAEGFDPKQIFVSGHSAGAHMTACLVTIPEIFQSLKQKPKGYIGLEGIYDVVALVKRWPGYKDWFLTKAFGPDELWAAASPTLMKVLAKEPWLVVHSLEDELVDTDQSMKWAEHVGKAATYFQVSGPTHFGITESLGASGDKTTARILDFVRTP